MTKQVCENESKLTWFFGLQNVFDGVKLPHLYKVLNDIGLINRRRGTIVTLT